jgi:hypothetical protein
VLNNSDKEGRKTVTVTARFTNSVFSKILMKNYKIAHPFQANAYKKKYINQRRSYRQTLYS